MSHSMTRFSKILTLVIRQVFFISFGILCEFPVLPDVYILLTPQERGAEGTDE